MAHGPYWADLPVDALGHHYVSPTKWDELVGNIIQWKADQNAGGKNLSNLGMLTFSASGYINSSVGIGTIPGIDTKLQVAGRVRIAQSGSDYFVGAAPYTGFVPGDAFVIHGDCVVGFGALRIDSGHNAPDRYLLRLTRDSTTLFTFATNGALIAYGTASKPGGGTWADTSDARTKRSVEDFSDGLSVLRGLRPVRYEANGLAGTVAGYKGISLVAQEAMDHAPYCVGARRGKLCESDGEETDIYTFDFTPLLYCLLNAAKELDRRVTALEGA